MFAPRLIKVHIVWRKVDHYFHGRIIGTHFEETLNLVVSLNIAYVIWDALRMHMQKIYRNMISHLNNK